MHIAWLGDPACRELDSVGGKAANLSLLAADHTVPPGFCLTTDAFRASLNGRDSPVPRLTATIAAELESAYSKLGSLSGDPISVAVRSSAVDEDGQDDSFAGQHETYLNVTGCDSVKDAVQRCWESAFSERALSYRKSRGLAVDDVPLAVLVQQLVRADISAVVFSMNPVTGNANEVVITANWGLGESIVAGTVTPDTITLGKLDLLVSSYQIGDKEQMTIRLQGGTADVKTPQLMRSLAVISAEQAAEMARLAMDLEEQMGWPVDVECAYQDGQLYILQCRPVTTGDSPQQADPTPIPVPAGFPVTWADPEDATLHWGHDPMHFPNPVKPLEIDHRSANHVTRGFAHYGKPLRVRFLVINGYHYRSVIPTLPPTLMDAQNNRADQNVRAAAARLGELWEDEWFPEIQTLLSAWDGLDLRGASMPELLEHLDVSDRLSDDLMYLHVRIVQPVYRAIGLFHEFFHDLFEDAGAFGAMTLLQGFENKTLETAHALWDLSRSILERPEILHVFRDAPAADVLSKLAALPGAQPFCTALSEYLSQYGEKSDLWGITAPTWIEDPTPVVENLKDYIEQPERDPRAELAALAAALALT